MGKERGGLDERKTQVDKQRGPGAAILFEFIVFFHRRNKRYLSMSSSRPMRREFPDSLFCQACFSSKH